MKTTTRSIKNIIVAVLGIAMPSLGLCDPVVNWQAPFNISGNSDVKVKGDFVYAYNFGSSNVTTVNGLTFAAFNLQGGLGASLTLGNITLSPENATHNIAKAIVTNNVGTPFTSLSSEYQTLIGSINYASTAGGGNLIVTLGGLTIDQEYQVQFWVTDPRNSIGTSFNNTKLNIYSGSYMSDDMSMKVGGLSNNLGQTVIAKFIADTNSLNFTITSQNLSGGVAQYVRLNALTLQAIPEPSSVVLVLSAAGLALLGYRRFF